MKLEKIALSGTFRVLGISESWLQRYVNEKYAQTTQKLKVADRKKAKFTVQMDELWSFVDNKGNKLVALDVPTRQIIGLHIGDRSRDGAKALWDSLPPKRYQAVGKETG
ncbi:hypothetical protein [Candidatus Albibeggiatoa sp. nov. BB20]|uniref:hypothetical protein n=1 Tax=Candidatus Albibeggiatoa sp. nov. BB20 TaxID=3162723 RepID=UPI003365ABFD